MQKCIVLSNLNNSIELIVQNINLKIKEPMYLTKNVEGDLVIMDIEAFNRREKILRLKEELLLAG